MLTPVAAARQTSGPRDRRCRAWLWLIAAALVVAGLMAAPRARAQGGVEVLGLAAHRTTEGVSLDYQLRVGLPRAVEEAAQRGVPLYFHATASVFRSRWYWRDDRVSRMRREWRLTFQPLTSTWRVSQGGLGQSHATLAEALTTMTRTTGWRLADATQADGETRHYVEFEWGLDTAQLPRPLQIGLTGGNEWQLGIERTLRLESRAEPRPEAGKAAAEPK
jgi:Domain of unknown function (DUF4390)